MSPALTKAVRPIVAAVLMILGLASAAAASETRPDAEVTEYQLKAAYLYNFARFVEWPDSAFASEDAEIKIGILQPDPFGPAIDSLLVRREVAGRPIRIERYAKDTPVTSCHILFVPSGEEGRIPEAWNKKGSPTLIVGESPEFARRLGMVGFFEESERLRFEINPKVTQQHGLRINSKLLGLAVVVSEEVR